VSVLDRLPIPIVQAPMAGGPSTPELAAAVSQVGALGFVAAGYRSAAAMAEHSAHAPIAYPEIHHVTAALRAHARRHGDADLVNLWAGEAHQLARARPAAGVVTGLARDARAALQRAERRMRDPVHASVTA